MTNELKYTVKKATISDKIYFYQDDIIDVSFDHFRYVLFNYNLGDRFYSTLEIEDEKSGLCSVPSGSWHKLNILELEDKRYVSPEYDWDFKGSLRPNQQLIADKIYSNNKLYSGLIQAPCGFGKSFLGGYLIAKNKKTTVIICHTKLLAEQWFNLLKEVIPTAEIGFIGDGKEIIKPVTIAIYKSLLTRLSKIDDTFETIIVDECLDYETYIKTRNGPMKIGVIVNNKLPVEVESWNAESNCFEYKKVYNWFKNNQIDNFIKINTTPRGSISCTKNHTIYTYDVLKDSIERKLAENIEIGDNLVCSPSQGKTVSTLNKGAIKPFSIRKVISIETKKPTGGFRYNISVEDNHNYSTSTSLVGNCHLSPADTFSRVVNGINAKTKIGLSATPVRKDGLHVILPDYFGPNRLIAIDDSKLSASVEVVKTDIPFRIINPNRDWARQLNVLAKNTKYLDLIAQTANDKIAHGRCPLILSERIEMLEELKTRIPGSVLLVGATKNTNREDILANAGNKYSAILSTRIFDEGISCHRLDTLVLTCPGNNYAKLEQRIGRILRQHPDKKDPLIIDFWLASPIIYRQQQNRLEWYRKQNYEILNS